MTIGLQTFAGRLPRTADRLLSEQYGVIATNCDLRRGKIEPIKGMTTVETGLTYGTKTIFLLGDSWINFGTQSVSVVKAQIADSYDRIYLTGRSSAHPEQTDSTLYPTMKRLGVIPPTTAPAMAVVGSPSTGTLEVGDLTDCVTDGTDVIACTAHGLTLKPGDILEITSATTEADIGTYEVVTYSEDTITINIELTGSDTDVACTITRATDAGVQDTISYYYTRVVKWPDESEEESQPSEASPVTDIYEGEAVVISGFEAGTDNDVTHFRIYRLSSGSSSADFFFLAEIDVATTEFEDDLYDEEEEVDHALLDVGADICETEDWAPPPNGLSGLVQFSNGILAGFVGNKLYFSEPWVGYAWPDAYSLTFDYDIIGLAVYEESIVVVTEVFPYIVTGLDPESLTQTIIPYEQSCVSKEGIVATNVGVIYPSPDGLFLFKGTAGTNLTKSVFTKEQWQALSPETLVSFYYDDQYFGFFYGTGTAILFNFKDNPYIVDLSIPASAITGGYMDPNDDTLYLADGTSIKSWGTGSALTFTWKSKPFRQTDYCNYGCASVIADGVVTCNIYADSVLKHSQAVVSNSLFRLPSGFLAKDWQVEVTGTNAVEKVVMTYTPSEIT